MSVNLFCQFTEMVLHRFPILWHSITKMLKKGYRIVYFMHGSKSKIGSNGK